MIISLYIKDFALIDEIETGFEPGLNIMTGETGAGKSIIIGALNILLGDRAQTDSIRQGATKAVAEVVLRTGGDEKLTALLQEHEVETGNEIILRREVRQSGSRAFINDTPVQLSVLRNVGRRLVDLHGQHDHQLLLREEHHREVLDERVRVAPKLSDYQSAWKRVNELRQKRNELRKQERELREKQELYRFQFNELKTAALQEGEAEKLEQDIRLLDSSEVLSETASRILEAGREAEVNALELLRVMQQALNELTRLEPEFESYINELDTARISVEELIRFTETYRNNIEFNPVQLEKLRQRQAEIRWLEKKYGMDAGQLLARKEELSSLLGLADNFEIELEKADKEIDKALKVLSQKAEALHNERIEEGKKLSEAIEKELMNLGFSHARFCVEVNWRTASDGWIEVEDSRVDCQPDGPDQIQFLISTNKGELPKPLSRTASGGEMSRVMLALKSILAREQSLPVMIFDEIDTGISGPVALQVGRTMRELAGHCQIISITHLPQIAAMGHLHFVVRKEEREGRTVTLIEKLNQENHIREVAKLMSGAEITPSALDSARELVESSYR